MGFQAWDNIVTPILVSFNWVVPNSCPAIQSLLDNIIIAAQCLTQLTCPTLMLVETVLCDRVVAPGIRIAVTQNAFHFNSTFLVCAQENPFLQDSTRHSTRQGRHPNCSRMLDRRAQSRERLVLIHTQIRVERHSRFCELPAPVPAADAQSFPLSNKPETHFHCLCHQA